MRLATARGSLARQPRWADRERERRGRGREGSVSSINPTIKIGKRSDCVWLPAKKFLHAYVHRWAESPRHRWADRKRERNEKRGGGSEGGRRFID